MHCKISDNFPITKFGNHLACPLCFCLLYASMRSRSYRLRRSSRMCVNKSLLWIKLHYYFYLWKHQVHSTFFPIPPSRFCYVARDSWMNQIVQICWWKWARNFLKIIVIDGVWVGLALIHNLMKELAWKCIFNRCEILLPTKLNVSKPIPFEFLIEGCVVSKWCQIFFQHGCIF